MKALRTKHGYAWYKEVSHEYDMVGINQAFPAFAIAAYQNRETKQWDQFLILKLGTHQGFPAYRKQIRLGTFTSIQDVTKVVEATIKLLEEQEKLESEPKKVELNELR